METKTGHTAIDFVFDLFGGAITFISLYYGEQAPLIHVHLPPIAMELLQSTAWGVSISVGTLTMLNIIGYEPMWLRKTKSYFKNKSK